MAQNKMIDVGYEIDKRLGQTSLDNKWIDQHINKNVQELVKEFKDIDKKYNERFNLLDADRRELYRARFNQLCESKNQLYDLLDKPIEIESKRIVLESYLKTNIQLDCLFELINNKIDATEIKVEERKKEEKKNRFWERVLLVGAGIGIGTIAAAVGNAISKAVKK